MKRNLKKGKTNMEVTLIDYTGFGSADPARHAANVLVFTKATRLNMSPGLFAEIALRTDEEIMAELDYMVNTIPSSWEFVNYTFLITSVTRAFTHQFVRTRTGSYAQQTMRVLDVDGWTYGTGPTISDDSERHNIYDDGMEVIADIYNRLIEEGAAIEDARGILPTNIHTNIVAKFDLRTMVDLHRKRSSGRVQGEYRDVLKAMVARVLEVHPWASLFFDRSADRAAAELRAEIDVMVGDDKKRRMDMHKLVDQIVMG